MIIRDQESSFEITLAEVDAPPAGTGDGHFRVKVAAHGFAGENYVWVEAFDFHVFVDELVALQRDGTGSAALESMSPHELRIVARRLEKSDQEEDYAFEGELRRTVFIHSRRRRVENRLVFVLDLDAADLAETVAGFEQLRGEFPLP